MPDEGTPQRGFALSFGLERLGLVALRAPYVTAVLILVVSAFALVGFMNLKVDD